MSAIFDVMVKILNRYLYIVLTSTFTRNMIEIIGMLPTLEQFVLGRTLIRKVHKISIFTFYSSSNVLG
jgi:hypothetical protein